ncbi:MAG TPA: anthrone oxygenase family protein [Burkholderiaceae bacterium]|nr:anthrone oxygenase family protein [Burkholderiaceae bacterium]
MLNLFDAIACLVCVGAGAVGGVFFAFSTFIMKALGQLPATQGILAMQRINVVVLNPLFLALFMGTALLSAGALAAALVEWSGRASPWLLAAGLVYLVGSFLVTLRFNVPRNERLATMSAEAPQAQAYWPLYAREWQNWNHVRTTASLASAACAAVALAVS